MSTQFLLFPLGIFLTYKATTDSAIMNLDSYSNVFRRIFKKELMSHYIPVPQIFIFQDEIEDEKYILTLRSLIFNAKKCERFTTLGFFVTLVLFSCLKFRISLIFECIYQN